MNDQQYYAAIDQTFDYLQNRIDQLELDIDYEMTAGMLTLTFPNQSKMVLNRQAPLHQLWLATKKQGYHFELNNNEWSCNRSHKSLAEIFNAACAEELGNPIQVIEDNAYFHEI